MSTTDHKREKEKFWKENKIKINDIYIWSESECDAHPYKETSKCWLPFICSCVYILINDADEEYSAKNAIDDDDGRTK